MISFLGKLVRRLIASWLEAPLLLGMVSFLGGWWFLPLVNSDFSLHGEVDGFALRCEDSLPCGSNGSW